VVIFERMEEIASPKASEVQNLEFIRISDDIRPNEWVEWEVRFTLDGLEYEGFLGACPFAPYVNHDEYIENPEKR
jgi:hypothetical protein